MGGGWGGRALLIVPCPPPKAPGEPFPLDLGFGGGDWQEGYRECPLLCLRSFLLWGMCPPSLALRGQGSRRGVAGWQEIWIPSDRAPVRGQLGGPGRGCCDYRVGEGAVWRLRIPQRLSHGRPHGDSHLKAGTTDPGGRPWTWEGSPCRAGVEGLAGSPVGSSQVCSGGEQGGGGLPWDRPSCGLAL